MTNEIEKQFFFFFLIEPKFKGYSNTEELSTCGVIPCGNIKYFNTIEEMDKANYWCFNMWELDEEDKDYPQITDHILLELICITHTSPVITFVSRDVKSLKEEVLMVLCNWVSSRNIKQQVQAIFKGGNNND